jgi:hypothetical protein
MIDEADINRDGEVDETEFFNLMKKINVLWLSKKLKISIFNLI